MEGVEINGCHEAAHILSLSIPGVPTQNSINILQDAGICVSAGSACAANSKKKSAALMAFGVSDADMDSTIRVSISHTNTDEDIDAFIAALSDGIASLQRVAGAKKRGF